MMKLKRIIQMLSDGKSQNEICRETSSSKKTVSGYKKLAYDTKLHYQELLLMEDSELEKLLQAPKVIQRRLCGNLCLGYGTWDGGRLLMIDY